MSTKRDRQRKIAPSAGKNKPKTQQGIPVYCRFDKLIPATDLKPHDRNPNQHSDEQIERLVFVIQATGWRNPVSVSNRSGLVIKGHARLRAGLQLVDTVPVEFQDYANEEAENADLLADNVLAELSHTDDTMLAELLDEMRTNGDAQSVKIAGYMPKEVEDLLASLKEPKTKKKKGKTAFLKICPKCGEEFE